MSPEITKNRWLKSMMWRALVACGALLVGSTGPANGAFIPTAVGNTNMDFLPGIPGFGGIDGTVSFAVLAREGTSGDNWGTGFSGFDERFSPDISSIALDTSAQFLYLYQVANNGSNTDPLDTLAVTLIVPNTNITSWGHFSSLGFANDAAPVSGSNDFGTSGVFAFPAAANIGVDVPGIVDISSDAVESSRVRLLTKSIKTTWDSELTDGQRSVLVGFTSNLGPAFDVTTLRDGGLPAAGDLPTPTPEPSSLILGCLAAPWGFLMARRRMKNCSVRVS